MRNEQWSCTACPTVTRASLDHCPNCGGRLVLAGAGNGTVAENRVHGFLAQYDWLWHAYTVLTVLVVVGNVYGFTQLDSLDNPGLAVASFGAGVLLPIVSYFVPAARGFLRSGGRSLFGRIVLFLLPIGGLLSVGMNELLANGLVAAYVLYLILNWLVGDQRLILPEQTDSGWDHDV